MSMTHPADRRSADDRPPEDDLLYSLELMGTLDLTGALRYDESAGTTRTCESSFFPIFWCRYGLFLTPKRSADPESKTLNWGIL